MMEKTTVLEVQGLTDESSASDVEATLKEEKGVITAQVLN